MTTWSEPDSDGVTRRMVGTYRLRAETGGEWGVAGAYDGNAIGTAPDLASAQAAAYAAVEGLLRQALADFGLRFGKPAYGMRYAVASDQTTYVLFESTYREKGWCWKTPGIDSQYAATESEAIEAARAHDAARRGAK